jgi:hypothetical protein
MRLPLILFVDQISYKIVNLLLLSERYANKATILSSLRELLALNTLKEPRPQRVARSSQFNLKYLSAACKYKLCSWLAACTSFQHETTTYANEFGSGISAFAANNLYLFDRDRPRRPLLKKKQLPCPGVSPMWKGQHMTNVFTLELLCCWFIWQ